MASKTEGGSINPPPAHDPLNGVTTSEPTATVYKDAFAPEGESDNSVDRAEVDRAAAEGLFMELYSIDQQLKAQGHSLASLVSKLAGTQFGVYPVAEVYTDNSDIGFETTDN